MDKRTGVVPRRPPRVVKIDLGLTWSGGAPLPVLIQGDSTAVLVVRLDSEDAVGVIDWIGPDTVSFGGPGDEGIERHYLYGVGLEDLVWAGEVEDSPWAAAADFGHAPDPRLVGAGSPFLLPLRHFVLLFKDSTFECLARGYHAYVSDLEHRDLLKSMIDRIPLAWSPTSG